MPPVSQHPSHHGQPHDASRPEHLEDGAHRRAILRTKQLHDHYVAACLKALKQRGLKKNDEKITGKNNEILNKSHEKNDLKEHKNKNKIHEKTMDREKV